MTNKIKNKRLAFLFTKGMSLKKWDEAGILSREVELYNNLAKNFKRIYFFTYGGKDELEYTKFLESNIDIIYKKSKVSDNFYSFLLPFINKDIIKRCSLIKTNQMKGTVSAIIVKLVNWKIKLVVRTGYSQSFTSKKEKRIFEYLKYTVLEFFAYILCDLGIVSSIGIKEYILRKY